MAITYSISGFNGGGGGAFPAITYPFNSAVLNANGDGVDSTLVIPLAQYPFLLPLNEKNTPGILATASSPLTSSSLDPDTFELTLVWPNAGAAGGPVNIQVIYTSF